jgi:hypothetical protein
MSPAVVNASRLGCRTADGFTLESQLRQFDSCAWQTGARILEKAAKKICTLAFHASI